MKRKYKLPNLQPGVLTYSFNPSRWNTNEAKNLQRQPSLYSEFQQGYIVKTTIGQGRERKRLQNVQL